MFNLTLSPSQTEFQSLPGTLITQVFEIVNHSSATLTLTPRVLPFRPAGNDGSVSYDDVPASTIPFSLMNSDLKLDQPFTLPPNQKRQLILKIPAPAAEGDYYHTLFLYQDYSPASSGSLSSASARVGAHVLLTVSQNATPATSGRLETFFVFPKFKDILLTPLRFSATLRNASPYFFKSSGTLTITKNNLKIKELPLYPANVLSSHSRTLLCSTPVVPDSPPSPLPCTLSPPFWPGRYTATLSFDPAISTPPVSVSFYVFPFSLILILLPFLLFFLLLRRRH